MPTIGIQTDSVNEQLVGTVNGINTTFTTSQDFLDGTEVVFFDGVRMQQGVGCDYTTSESGGIGTGFDTITFAEAPKSRSAPKADSVVSILYVPA